MGVGGLGRSAWVDGRDGGVGRVKMGLGSLPEVFVHPLSSARVARGEWEQVLGQPPRSYVHSHLAYETRRKGGLGPKDSRDRPPSCSHYRYLDSPSPRRPDR